MEKSWWQLENQIIDNLETNLRAYYQIYREMQRIVSEVVPTLFDPAKHLTAAEKEVSHLAKLGFYDDKTLAKLEKSLYNVNTFQWRAWAAGEALRGRGMQPVDFFLQGLASEFQFSCYAQIAEIVECLLDLRLSVEAIRKKVKRHHEELHGFAMDFALFLVIAPYPELLFPNHHNASLLTLIHSILLSGKNSMITIPFPGYVVPLCKKYIDTTAIPKRNNH